VDVDAHGWITSRAQFVAVTLAGQRHTLRRPGRYRSWRITRQLAGAGREGGPREWAQLVAVYDRLLAPGVSAHLAAQLLADSWRGGLTPDHLKAGLSAAFALWAMTDRRGRAATGPVHPRAPWDRPRG
jgi:hypothetical protein